MKIKTAIIIAGGKGSRFKNLSSNDPELSIPKPMIKVLGKPMLEYNINWLKKNDIENIIIGVAFKKEKIIEYFGDGRKFGVNITYSHHSVEDGTGDAFRKAIENTNLTDKYFYAMNADQFTNFSLNKLFEHHISKKPAPLATILLVHPTCPFGMVKVDSDGWVESFQEKPKLNEFTNGGIYVFDIEIKKYLRGDVEKTTFVELSRMKKLQSLPFDGFWDTINTFKDLVRVEETFRKNENLRRYFENE
jgi:NDP-sugar pyrophosphorylase family protein